MAEQKNTIKLNGKIYDAKSGVLLDHNTHSKKASATHAQGKPDKTAQHRTPSHVKAVRKPHHSASAVHARKQRSKTLMRSVVKRPALASRTPVSGALDNGSSMHVVAAEPLLHGIDRELRVKKVKKSKLITRFGTFSGGPSFITKSEPIGVTPLPATSAIGRQAVRSESAPDFMAAIHKAKSHEQPSHKRVRRTHKAARKLHVSNRTFNAGAAALAIVLLVGFFAYQNKAGSEFRTAAAKAGIHASLPSYTPPGFAMSGPVQYEPGEVTVSFRSNSDQRNYSLSQQTSNWNNDALAASLASNDERSYNTVQNGDKTIFIYGDSDASWVKNGVLYQLSGDSTLSTDQILKIAGSI